MMAALRSRFIALLFVCLAFVAACGDGDDDNGDDNGGGDGQEQEQDD
jgi:hypothetical protein